MTDYETSLPPEFLADGVRLRTAFSTREGTVTRFLVQLEYRLDVGWSPVVRYDHDEAAPGGHDVTKEGLHRDVYRHGEKHRSVDVTGPLPAAEGFEFAEADLRENLVRYVERFEEWHGVKNGTDL